MKKNFSICFGLILSISIFAQSEDYYRLYNYAKEIPVSKTKNIEKLSKYCIKGAKSKKELAELIYYWIALNINYDVESYQNGLNINTSAECTFANKKSICEGYSKLYKELCDKVGLECVLISGFAKGYGYTGERINSPNHSWNAVKISNKWQLIDVTWGSGYVELINDTLVYKKLLCVRYLFDNPDDFILEHFPEDSKWQLLKKKISLDDFYSQEMETKRQERKAKIPK
jgi:transglutaminase/protease-like cytokinesis protein 3